MDYSDINNKWKLFLAENTFKEDKLINPKKKKKRKKNKEDGGKQIITNEWEEFQELEEDEMADGPGAGYTEATPEEEQESLEEMSAMSGGAVEGHAGGEEGPWISKEEFKKRWS